MKTNGVCKLSDEELADVIKNTPLVSIDLIVKNRKGEILLGLRKNDPAKDFWFVPGGRIFKNETLQQAFKRIAKEELNLDVDLKNAKLLNAYDHIYPENRFGIEGFGTHYVALGYEIISSITLQLSKDSQHSAYKWFREEDLLEDEKVHDNTKKFFASSITIPKDSGIYRALMSHYIHYDRQFWSRTQILLAIQGAALIGGYNLRSSWLGPAIMIGTFFLTFIVWGLIFRDISNSRKNQKRMDELANSIFKYSGAGRVISLRSDPPLKILSGRWLINIVVVAILILNLSLAWLYVKRPNFFPSKRGTVIINLENKIEELSSNLSSDRGKFKDQLKDLHYKLNTIEKDVSDVHSLKNQITELSSSLSTNTRKIDYQLEKFGKKLKLLENKLSNN